MDILGWLSAEAGQENTTRSDFMRWVNQYLLPNERLPVTAEELYSARCAVVHTYTTESKLTREKGVRKLNYTAGSRPSETFDSGIPSENIGFIHIPDLISEMVNATGKFLEDAREDQALMKRANDRAEQMIVRINGEWLQQ